MTTPNINTQKSSFFQGRKMWFWTAAGLGIVTLILLVIFLQSLISTTKYYVLNKDVAARTLITPDMLEEKVVSTGGQPPTAVDMATVTQGETYSKVALKKGDVLTGSTAGDLLPLRAGLPTNYVVASFVTPPNAAAGGNITRGDYVDIFYINEDQTSKLIFKRVLIVDGSQDLSSGGGSEDETTTATDDTATAPYRVGVPYLYTVGLTETDAAKLAVASRNSGANLYVVLSSKDTAEKGVKTPDDTGANINDMLSNAVEDSGQDTDNSFKTVKKDSESAGSSDSSSSSSNSDASSDATPTDSASPSDDATSSGQ
jgi:Flp pilus assembly protein CpaB